MAVSYDDIFGFVGGWIKSANEAMANYTTLDTNQTDLTTSNTFAVAPYDVHEITVKSTIDNLRQSVSAYASTVAQQCQQIMSNREGVIEELSLGNSPSWNVIANALMNAMVDDSESCAASVVTVGAITRTVVNATAGYGYADKGLDGVTSPISNGIAYDHYLNTDSQLAAASDDLIITCIQDSDSLGGTAGNEQWQIKGQPTPGSTFGWLSEGSGTGPTFTTIATSNSLFTNGDFETWSGTDVLSNWTYDTGAATTNWVQESSVVYRGTYSLKVLGSGAIATLTTSQAAPTSLQVKKRYAVGCWIRGHAGTSAGALTISFTGTGYTAGSTEKITLNTAALQTASWVHYKFFVNIPANIPSDFKIAISFTSSFNGTCYIDDLAIGTPTYHGGVCYVVFQGAGKFLKDDTFVLTVSNDDAGAFNKFFRKAFRLQVPTSGAPTQANSLTT